MKVLCKLFGHQPPVYAKKGWYSPGEEYAEVVLDSIDGTGRQHASVFAICPRCEERYKIGRIHIPENKKD